MSTTTLEDLSAAYDRAKSEFVSQAKAHADRSVLAIAARQAASAAQALNAEAYRKFHASEEDREDNDLLAARALSVSSISSSFMECLLDGVLPGASNDRRTDLGAFVKVDHVLVGHADAAR